ncbi:tail fiber protein [Aquimarina algiphila]|uniref:tail fiber protein n=1 Tax=Aquimarina algiphila TaxID=2047982 RepID=UPI002330D255|nr:tail fiber protein [Aquimarina algiphila]
MKNVILVVSLIFVGYLSNAQHIPIAFDYSLGYSSSGDKFIFDNKEIGNYSMGWYIIPGSAEARLSGYGGIKFFTERALRLTIAKSGNVGIGTKTPDSKLTVKGKIHAEEVKVDLSVLAPDYVFTKDYELLTIEEVQQHIKENGHLPNVPSAAEMETNGVELGVMNMKLLEKIEELTLYTIDQKQELKKQQEKLKSLEEKLTLLLENKNK